MNFEVKKSDETQVQSHSKRTSCQEDQSTMINKKAVNIMLFEVAKDSRVKSVNFHESIFEIISWSKYNLDSYINVS